MSDYFCTSCHKIHNGEPAERRGNQRWCEAAKRAKDLRMEQIKRERRNAGTLQTEPINGGAS